MTTNPPARDPADLHAELERVWRNPTGWRALTIVNHTTVGLRFMVTGFVFFLVAGVLAMLMRSQLALPGQSFMSAQAYQQAFTAHGTMMMFLFAVPMVEGLACYLIPKMIGARDLVFPRLGAFGYWCYLFGGVIFTSSLVLGLAPDSGWFMYTPLSSRTYSPGVNADFWLIGITFVEISSVAGAVELLVSILRTRAPGMALHRMPIFAWYILVTSVMILVGFPPLILGSILLELERAAGWAFFDVNRGGDPLLWQHLFWLFGHPEVYIIFLPAAGVVSTLVPVFARRPLVSYRWTVVAVVTTGFISFGLWVHHMFTVGIPLLAMAFFSAASMLVAVPTGIQIFVWLATLWTGRPEMRIPMLWLVGFLVVFVAGGLTGVMLALVPFDWQVHDTHFVVAHMHYVLVGGVLFPLLAGLYYWLPLATGRMPTEWLARWGFWLTFIGFNGTFLVMHWTGLLGMPRRIYTYEAGLGWELPNLVSSIFGFVMAAGIAMVVVDLATHARVGRRAPRNPWGADTLEWACAMPPAPYNFASQARIEARHPLWEQPRLPESIERGMHALAHARHGRRETFGTDPITGEPREVIHLPGNSWWPLTAAAAIGLVCIGLLTKVHALAIVAAIAAFAALLRWSWENGMHPSCAPQDDDVPPGLRLHSRTFDGPGLWGMGSTLLADTALYGSLVFGWLYLWVVAPEFEPPAQSPVSATALAAAAALATAAAGSLRHVQAHLRRGHDGRLVPGLVLATLLGAAHCAVLGWQIAQAPLVPQRSAHDAVMIFMLIYAVVHGALATVTTALQVLRVRHRYVGAFAPYEPAVLLQLWWFSAGIAWATALVLPGAPLVLGVLR
ncbi:cytochrome c oxidase subunit I [Caldimonas aquatica]|uniref:cytochrome-c oxidase n=1 Tax=Caldimonas aquatica TaxID=376175 RepID=A0ABY6MNY8_9BURK|nr:cytochrome c oxidase subunit I [Schlegelella aquatica]UZD54060.1 cytochrome c oxidase subunit I [Schlegelella aquatica]